MNKKLVSVMLVAMTALALVFNSCSKDSKDEPTSPTDTTVDVSEGPVYDLSWTEEYISAKREKINLAGKWYVSGVTSYATTEPETNIFATIATFKAYLDIQANGSVAVMMGTVNFGTGTWTLNGDQLNIVVDVVLAGHQDITVTLLNQRDGKLTANYVKSFETPVDYSEITLEPYTDGITFPEAALNTILVEGEPRLSGSWHLDRIHRFGAENKDLTVDYSSWVFDQNGEKRSLSRKPSKNHSEDADNTTFAVSAQTLTLGSGEAYTVIKLTEDNIVLRSLNTSKITDFNYDEYYFSQLIEPEIEPVP
ncbi:MAG: hypothetical protein IJU35_08955 [Paludibacteraceae bacterium]|nr:hypothetical protein [Paludibacteraceae bacterium]